MNILLADDHTLVREGITYVLRRLGDNIRLWEASDYAQIQEHIEQQIDFDLILLDLQMPGQDGFGGLRSIRSKVPNTPIVILTASKSVEDIQTTIDMGVSGYVPKSSTNEVLLSALQLVLSGGTYVPPEILSKLSMYKVNGAVTSMDASQRRNELATLTYRQRQILEQIVLGNANKEIARNLSIAEATVKSHIKGIFRQLNARNRTEAVHKAVQQGFTLTHNASDR